LRGPLTEPNAALLSCRAVSEEGGEGLCAGGVGAWLGPESPSAGERAAWRG
jgi:hypothetical protein